MKYDEDIKEKFYNSVKADENGCWIWQGKLASTRYGSLYHKGQQYACHRLSYTLHKGDIPSGMLVCHTCDVRECCNPAHLYVGTYKDNYEDMVRSGNSYIENTDRRGKNSPNAVLEDKDIELIYELVESDTPYTHKQIAARVGCNREVISCLLRGHTKYGQKIITLENSERFFLGFKITRRGVFEIHRLYNEGLIPKRIAEILHTSGDHVSRILRQQRNKKWCEEYYKEFPNHKRYVGYDKARRNKIYE